jgi:hypothetical protein
VNGSQNCKPPHVSKKQHDSPRRFHSVPGISSRGWAAQFGECLRVASCICCRGLAQVVIDPTNGNERLKCPSDSASKGINRAIDFELGAAQKIARGDAGSYHICRENYRRLAIVWWKGANPGCPWNDPTEGAEWDAWWILRSLRESGVAGQGLTELLWQKGRDRINKATRDAALAVLASRGLVESWVERSWNDIPRMVTMYRASVKSPCARRRA